MAANVHFIYNKKRHSVWWKKSEWWMCCAAECLTIMNRAETPPGFLSVMRWPGWIVLMGIKILFVIETQTSAGSLDLGKHEWRGEGERWMRCFLANSWQKKINIQKERKKKDDWCVEIYMMKQRNSCSAHVYFEGYYRIRHWQYWLCVCTYYNLIQLLYIEEL